MPISCSCLSFCQMHTGLSICMNLYASFGDKGQGLLQNVVRTETINALEFVAMTVLLQFTVVMELSCE